MIPHIVKKIRYIFLSVLLIGCNTDDDPIFVPQPSGAVLAPNVGGPAEPNQVWIDLDTKTMKVNQRDSWDFGFYNGNEFMVILNGSILMAAGKTEFTDIDAVTEANVASLKLSVLVNNFDAENVKYVDDIKGNYLKRTAIDKISINDSENKVYLINMGYAVYKGNETSLHSSGDFRGWKKVRILRYKNNQYKIQYANLSDTTHKEFIINKNNNYLFNFLSLENGIEDIQPPKDNWDLCFTVFTNENVGHGTYSFADFVILNTLNKTAAYQVNTTTSSLTYENFTKDQVDPSKFIYDDQRVIGSTWRSTYAGATVYTNRFYVIKDNIGTLYKIRFLKMTNNEGHRGYPEFEYKPL